MRGVNDGQTTSVAWCDQKLPWADVLRKTGEWVMDKIWATVSKLDLVSLEQFGLGLKGSLTRFNLTLFLVRDDARPGFQERSCCIRGMLILRADPCRWKELKRRMHRPKRCSVKRGCSFPRKRGVRIWVLNTLTYAVRTTDPNEELGSANDSGVKLRTGQVNVGRNVCHIWAS